METPFVFGRIATGKEFTNREKECGQLMKNFSSSINTILISPRRWGKSSLVLKAANEAKLKNESILFCFIDLFNIRSEEEFYETLATEVLKSTTSKWDELLNNVKKFLSHFIPKITFNGDIKNEFSLSLDWNEVKKQPDEILNLSEKIAIENQVRFVVCIDEFQNISEFENPLAFQKKLRSHWQKHQNTSYCLYGSKRHMMMEVFASSSMPFYKFGDLIFLAKINENDWKQYITKRFVETGKEISEQNAVLISILTECHPYYVQQLAQQTWLRTEKVCSEEIILNAFESISLQLSLLFQNITDNLSSSQIHFLEALISNASQLSSSETIQKYRLKSSSNVVKVRQSLINKEIIDIQNAEISILDPVYKYWLKHFYFNIKTK